MKTRKKNLSLIKKGGSFSKSNLPSLRTKGNDMTDRDNSSSLSQAPSDEISSQTKQTNQTSENNNPNIQSQQVISNTGDSKNDPGRFQPYWMILTLVFPYVVVGFFILLSIFNQNLKGVTYVIGLIVAYFISGLINSFYKRTRKENNPTKYICSFFGMKIENNGIPYSTLIYFFTFAYLLIPMVSHNIINFPLVFCILLISGLDFGIKYKYKCTDYIGVLISAVLGFLSGLIWSILIFETYPELLYHTDYVSNKVACSKPGQQRFKCSVYKNGELIDSNMGFPTAPHSGDSHTT